MKGTPNDYSGVKETDSSLPVGQTSISLETY